MPHNMADNRALEPSFAEKRLYLVSRAVKCLSDSVFAQQSEDNVINVSQSNQPIVHSISEHQTAQESAVSSNHTIKFDIKSPPPITVNNYAENHSNVSFVSKIKSLFISQPVSKNDINKVIN